ncbi:valine--tRNA ligase [Frankliniella occidentalis]|uniref:Valine--tRNA ligase n=1 Tax=Frankliniella occidentalis TaxID=133901 RepID=A0A6J1S0A2_FRAOC|nr:valine--tRNA ligase [Frankliniella occidentalis]
MITILRLTHKFNGNISQSGCQCLKRYDFKEKVLISSLQFSRRISYSSILNAETPKKDVSGKLPQKYDAEAVESEWYRWWEQEGFFKVQTNTKNLQEKQTFTMILPPPNVTGTLHLGHALTVTIQDVLARWMRMCGRNVLWIPGTDHAGIATQVVVEKQLLAQHNINRHTLGRENFLKEIRKWQREKGSHIQNQLRLMGASLDWSREYFTMDQKQSSAVTEAFIRLFEEGLVYRSNVPVSWSCWLRSTISDIEIENQEINGPTDLHVPGYTQPVQFGKLTNIVYKSCDSVNEIIVSTTRPETMLGDVAIAVHPADSRYKHLHGSFFWHPYRHEKIPLICDEFVDQEFGTGAVKITPAHDRTDFDVAMRHNLQLISVINEYGNICDNFVNFKGMKRFIARDHLVKDLSAQGLIQGENPHKMIVPVCGRSGDIVELIPKPQWFLSTKDIAQKAIKAVKEKKLHFSHKQAEKLWLQWFENNQDWCLSRQLWWGHRIPVFKCCFPNGSSEKWVAAGSGSEAKVKASAQFSCQPDDPRLTVLQDEDVLDTWFSSSILPFSALGWPEMTEEFQNLYPLSLMETGHDILLFWVARMVILGELLTHKLPFENVLLHGVIRDASGRKMSKSIGNVVSPEDIREGRTIEELVSAIVLSHESGVIPKQELKNAIQNQKKMFPEGIPQCGTDALRFTLCSYPIESHFIDFNVKNCEANRKFCNKFWQACRYVEGFMEDSCLNPQLKFEDQTSLCVMDMWVLSKLSGLVHKLENSLSRQALHECVEALRVFIHHEFCDVYLESTKFLKNTDSQAKQNTRRVLSVCVENILALLSPFMPFLTEELYQRLSYFPKTSDSITKCHYPQPKEWMKWYNKSLESEIDLILKTASVIRHLKKKNGLKNKDTVSVALITKSELELEQFFEHKILLENLSRSSIINVLNAPDEVSNDFMTEGRLDNSCIVKIVLEGENQKLQSNKMKSEIIALALKKQSKLKEQILRTRNILENPKFWTNAPEDVKQTLPLELTSLEEEQKKIETFLNQIPNLNENLMQNLPGKK